MCDQGQVQLHLKDLLSDPCYLLITYQGMKRGASPGVDMVPIENMTLSNIIKLAKDLQEGSYKPTPARRVHIPKAKGGTRPLGIAASRDKIVQQALKNILVPLFEPIFLNESHGFRPGRGCHSALQHLDKQCRRPV